MTLKKRVEKLESASGEGDVTLAELVWWELSGAALRS
jgi:hypothetical protein